MRIIIDLAEDQVDAPAVRCKSEGISRVEAFRRAVSDMLAPKKKAGRDVAFAAWRNKKIDSPEFVDALRKEWE